jgi:hypothetical protein
MFVKWTVDGIDTDSRTTAFTVSGNTTATAIYGWVAKGDADHTLTNPIDFWDFMAFADQFGSHVGQSNYDRVSDFQDDAGNMTVDGQVDFWDFMAFAARFGTNPYPHR